MWWKKSIVEKRTSLFQSPGLIVAGDKELWLENKLDSSSVARQNIAAKKYVNVIEWQSRNKNCTNFGSMYIELEGFFKMKEKKSSPKPATHKTHLNWQHV